VRAILKLSAVVLAPAIASWAYGAYAQENKLSVPNVTVTAPAVPVEPPYLRNPWKSGERNPYMGRYRVEEDKFPQVPCNVARIAFSASGKCLQGYRMTPGAAEAYRGAKFCDMALDVVISTVGNLAIEADTLIFDPYKLTAVGMPGKYCYVNGYSGYDQEDFQDMNQVTRRGIDWHNLVSDGEDKSIEFSDGPRHCIAVKKAGPPWRGGHIYMLHASICRTDTGTVQPQDISYVLGSLQIRQYDLQGNLRKAGG